MSVTFEISIVLSVFLLSEDESVLPDSSPLPPQAVNILSVIVAVKANANAFFKFFISPS
jgi:hypothetical protein